MDQRVTLNWSIPIGSILLWLSQTAVVCLVAFVAFQRAIDRKFAAFDVLMVSFRGDVKSDVRDITRRLSSLETGQDEWTKTLRARTHELAEQVNVLGLKVDRLERPHGTS